MKDQLPYVVGVYMGIWVVLLGYVFIVNNKLSGLKKELTALNKAVEKNNK